MLSQKTKASSNIFCFLSLFNLVILSESSFLTKLTLAEESPTITSTQTRENQENSLQTEIPTTLTSSQESNANSNKATVFIVGLNVGRRNVNPGVLVRGEVGDTEAIALENWLVPYDVVLQALNFDSNAIEENQVELRSPFKVVRLDLNKLRSDSDLGLVLSIREIEEILGIKAEFDWREYAVVFEVPDVESAPNKNVEEQPVVLEGLPELTNSDFTFSMVEQQVNLTNSEGSDLRNQGKFSAVGTVFDSSWFLRLNQGNLTDNKTWQLSELQFLRQTDKDDYYLGSQSTFWRNQSGGDFWGFTTIERQGFSPFQFSGSSGANPTQRLQPKSVPATVTGRAEPGTLVQLVADLYHQEVVAEQLVDSSGTYRFDNVHTGRQVGTNYYLLVYPDGSLAVEPQIEEVRFTHVPEQLPAGTSARVMSGGWQRQLDSDEFFGKFTDLNLGVAQRWGLSEDLTLGVGGVYNSSINGLAEVFYQPTGTPLGVAISGLVGDDLDINADVVWDAYPNFYATLSSDFDTAGYSLDWQIIPQMRFFSSGSLDRAASFGLQYYSSGANHTTRVRLSVDTDAHLNWSLNQQLGDFNLTHRGNNSSSASGLSYRFTPYQSLVLNYNTISTSESDSLLTAYWRYRSPTRNQYGESLWQTELGYGIGSQGSGIYASAGTTVIPGILLKAEYEGVSLTSDPSRFNLQVVSSLELQGGMSPGNRRLERLRTEGGLLVQPFYDLNSNGQQDANEEAYTVTSDFLIVNNKYVRLRDIDVRSDRLLVRLSPGNYRLDLDTAGFPPDLQPVLNSFAVEVVEGSYTPIPIPLQPFYTVAGVVTNAEGKPVLGAKVEAFTSDGSLVSLSITNSAGVYYLDRLQQGTYHLKINGRSVAHNTVTVDADLDTLQELNLKLP